MSFSQRKMADPFRNNGHVIKYISEPSRYLSSQAPDPAVFSHNIPIGQFGLGTQTYDELCEFPPTATVHQTGQSCKENKPVELKFEGNTPINAKKHRANVNAWVATPKRVKTEDVPPQQEIPLPQILTRSQNFAEAQIDALWAKIKALEAENQQYRAQAEGHLDEKIRV
ncbi:hypothetical protein B0H10DRAFT_1943338 [Mycena sp. CBHHK59/15]|nr:hypothetical protein B0H10DRAFT_1943338 [Mycena sp. CBHHK59/15]